MGLGLEGLRQQLSEMITSSAQNTSQQSPSTAQTQVGCKYEFSRVTITVTHFTVGLQNVK